MDKSTSFTGDLDLAARSLEKIAPYIIELWNQGEYRMKRDQINRIKDFLNRIKKSDREIRNVLRLFEEIAATPNAQTKVETREEKIGLIPAHLADSFDTVHPL